VYFPITTRSLAPYSHLEIRAISYKVAFSEEKKDTLLNVGWNHLLPVSGRIIVIEDDPTLCALMTDILSEIGIESCAFGSADDALTYLLEAHGHCPLVIVDQGLPGQIQGAEFIAMVKGKWPSVASILTSGYAIEEAMVPPSTIYLHKPWALDDLVLAVATLLQPGYPLQKI
jgi:DNA-binding NtrC family response regulator